LAVFETFPFLKLKAFRYWLELHSFIEIKEGKNMVKKNSSKNSHHGSLMHGFSACSVHVSNCKLCK
jgi:hypothetical protein